MRNENPESAHERLPSSAGIESRVLFLSAFSGTLSIFASFMGATLLALGSGLFPSLALNAFVVGTGFGSVSADWSQIAGVLLISAGVVEGFLAVAIIRLEWLAYRVLIAKIFLGALYLAASWPTHSLRQNLETAIFLLIWAWLVLSKSVRSEFGRIRTPTSTGDSET